MSFYNALFGKNPSSDLLLAILDIKQNDVERFRDCSIDFEASRISIYTRTGGGNRDDYPNEKLTSHACYLHDEDDDFDSTYATYYFKFPEEMAADVVKLANVEENGFPASIIKKYNAMQSRRDKSDLYEERSKKHYALCKYLQEGGYAHQFNGHTIVPLCDSAIQQILRAVKNDGCWNAYTVRLMKVIVLINQYTWGHEAKVPEIERDLSRVKINDVNGWPIDIEYTNRIFRKFSGEFGEQLKILGINAIE